MTLIARYKLDGNARDSAGTAHGTAVDVTWAPSQLVDGGGEARLNGTTSRIDTAIQFSSETAVSLPVWFRPGPGAGHLIGQHDGTNGLAIEQTETGKIRLVVGGTASTEVTVYPGEYHHAVAVYDAAEATLYLDNEAVATVTATVTWPAVPVTLGARADSSAALACDVVDVGVYDSKEIPITVPTDGLTIRYTMDDVTGSTLVAETGDYNGTISGAAQEPGIKGQALAFNKSNNDHVYVQIENSIRYNILSISCWVKREYSTAFEAICSFSGIGNERVDFYIQGSSGFLRVQVSSSGGSQVFGSPSGGSVHDGEWHLAQIEVNADIDEVNFFVDSQHVGSLDISAIGYTGITPQSLVIGCMVPENKINFLNGMLDIFSTHNRSLTQTERQDLYTEVTGNTFFNISGITYRVGRDLGGVGQAYNPHPSPVPNPTAIPRSGRSSVQGVTALLARPAWFDQRDGSGGSHLTPEGVVSRPDRQGRISGNTTDPNGNPVSRRVRCFERTTGRIVREGWSNSAGYYQFDDLDPAKRFTIVAHDHTGEYNAVIADNAQPEVPA
ncbi:LamG-like jellyroll fold domain-containing protein [Halomonas lysinitropha]|uniref:Laminin G domain-containing protein n=1 Tax=Halomonas lysinitropha TaxID=2607506 RepID=A0A5K1I4W0_9GAMM|nr:LamG-like jellyroll fold domain-containing protein [Halomonas lysinitropha]VVZ96516.1 hypothetical protein HALO32_02617 [Halomonas lysinitropha]